MDELTPDDAAELSAEVESSFDPLEFAEVRITVRLPGKCTESGTPEKFGYVQLMLPEDIRIQNPRRTLPYVIERAAKALMTSMRFR